jgi:hypothetical protein
MSGPAPVVRRRENGVRRRKFTIATRKSPFAAGKLRSPLEIADFCRKMTFSSGKPRSLPEIAECRLENPIFRRRMPRETPEMSD